MKSLWSLLLSSVLLGCATPGVLVYDQPVLQPVQDALCSLDRGNTKITVVTPEGIRNPGWGSNSQLQRWTASSSVALAESLRGHMYAPQLTLTIADVWPALDGGDVARTVAGVLLGAMTIALVSPPDPFFYIACLELDDERRSHANGHIRWSGSTWYMARHPEATYDITYVILEELSRRAWLSLLQPGVVGADPCIVRH